MTHTILQDRSIEKITKNPKDLSGRRVAAPAPIDAMRAELASVVDVPLSAATRTNVTASTKDPFDKRPTSLFGITDSPAASGFHGMLDRGVAKA